MSDIPECVSSVLYRGESRWNDSATIEVIHVQVDGVDNQLPTQATLGQVTGDQFSILKARGRG